MELENIVTQAIKPAQPHSRTTDTNGGHGGQLAARSGKITNGASFSHICRIPNQHIVQNRQNGGINGPISFPFLTGPPNGSSQEYTQDKGHGRGFQRGGRAASPGCEFRIIWGSRGMGWEGEKQEISLPVLAPRCWGDRGVLQHANCRSRDILSCDCTGLHPYCVQTGHTIGNHHGEGQAPLLKSWEVDRSVAVTANGGLEENWHSTNV
ncbi:hypothetical protein FIBSPDRAFT_934925 [Athelia psychrophila]|uniref:Uncharacterized protein n=1 Tax=Athelia psychrophila TaxID=1759441 RepID=A0A166EMK5_9AGAM|nr:hypothetical protein FIBSPDRAFT_934925 [Fibularhizoctonia sp. CBS 109695]